MHDSLTPLGGMIPMINIMLGEIIFGGVGSGLYGMLLFAILAVFIAGLMVGRTPEYLGKKIEAKEVKMAMLAILILPFSILGFSAIAVVAKDGLAGMANAGPHGFSEALYAYTSATGNNGSAFAGLSANTMFYNTTLAFAMLIGRFLMVIPALAIAGSLAQQEDPAAISGNVPDPRLAVRPARLGRDPHPWRSHILPRALARTGRRTFRDDRRSNLLSFEVKSMLAPAPTAKSKRTATATITDPEDPDFRPSALPSRNSTLSRSPRTR